jgi:hypothetical protein
VSDKHTSCCSWLCRRPYNVPVFFDIFVRPLELLLESQDPIFERSGEFWFRARDVLNSRHNQGCILGVGHSPHRSSFGSAVTPVMWFDARSAFLGPGLCSLLSNNRILNSNIEFEPLKKT